MAETQHEQEWSPMSSENVSTAQLAQYLKGIDFPANKQDIIETAKSNSAPDEIMTFMNELPDRSYDQPAEVEEEFSKIS